MMRVFNTLGRRKQAFVPRTGKKQVNMFVCGPTVYALSHIGHARTYISYDVMVKYLRWKGYNVFYLVNITDIDDKIIDTANKLGEDPLAYSNKYTEDYYADMKSIGVDAVSKYAKASDHIKDILRQIKVLQKKGYLYELEDGLYFEVEKFKEYGKLSGRTRKDLREGDSVSRIDDSVGKKDLRDFCVWKFPKPGEPVWKTDIGEGRPGWHIEDTAITEHFFGSQYDVHGAGKDLIFPHHEAEVTLMEAYSGKKPFVKYWLHVGFLNVEGRKMSKSLGNFITIRDALAKWGENTLRFMFLSTQYSSPIDYSEASLQQAKTNLDRLRTAYAVLGGKKGKLGKGYLERFEKAMDDDFNTPKVVALLLEMAKKANKTNDTSLKKAFDVIGSIFGIDFKPEKTKQLPKALAELIKKREAARRNKDWKESDRLRTELAKKGVLLDDTPTGTIWKWA